MPKLLHEMFNRNMSKDYIVFDENLRKNFISDTVRVLCIARPVLNVKITWLQIAEPCLLNASFKN